MPWIVTISPFVLFLLPCVFVAAILSRTSFRAAIFSETCCKDLLFGSIASPLRTVSVASAILSSDNNAIEER